MNYSYPGPYNAPPYAPPPPTPQQSERRELRSAAGFIGVLMLFLTITMQFTYSLVILLLTLVGFLPPQAAMMNQLGLDNTTFLCVYACVYTLAMGLPLLLVMGRRHLFSLKPHTQPITAGNTFLSVLAAVGGCMAANIVTSILMAMLENWDVPIPDMPDMMESTPTSLLLNLFIIAVLPAILEESVFRGCVLRVLRPFGDGFAVVVSALLFGLMHGNIRQIPFAIIVGLILGWLYVVTNSLWLPMTVHFINNALSVVMEYLAFDLTESGTAVFYSGIIYGLAALGAVTALVLLFTRGSRMKMARSNTCLRMGDRVSTLFKSPAFVISVFVFIGLTILELIS